MPKHTLVYIPLGAYVYLHSQDAVDIILNDNPDFHDVTGDPHHEMLAERSIGKFDPEANVPDLRTVTLEDVVPAGIKAYEPEPEEQNFYFTFGGNTNLYNRYMKIRGTFEDTRQMFRDQYGSLCFAFQYDEDGFRGQPQAFDLTEVPFGIEIRRIK